ncbi:hypothetical protein GCM10010112_71810 [Actinoplanes lobatus]|uniref:Uncharacterized protein n=1 Tax=Actinoplanes lobatus TaxID=113568 RepID=A0A7W7MJU8_9ACTN|nr:hypothetical protein [Actinoplanes lobatus]MBB4752838.1 hypothetical protein [Actinoplanes lobatus]GGN88381.1 hypothetical protein GCM10010112_71810 [Actinoplanes lobatus]GIE39448.1 hypothetical protein Alo02nite_23460 [Actinoplanes lobatus]
MPDNHDDLYTLVRTEFEPVRMRPDLDDITTRGRTLRRRRHIALTATLAAAAASALVLTLPTGTKPGPPAPMNLAAWSIESTPDGTVVLTIRQLTDADRLTAALKTAGVPALVEFERVPPQAKTIGCADNGQPSLPQLYDVTPTQTGNAHPGEHIFTIRRDRMPPGTNLHFVLFEEQTHDGTVAHSVHTSLVQGTPLRCEPSWNNPK